MSTQEILGYKVEKLEAGAAYLLTGARGAQYHLVRHQNRPELMYVTQSKTGVVVGLKGNYTFTDRDGELRCWYSNC